MNINRELLKSSERIKRKKAETALTYFALFLAFIFFITNLVSHFDKLYIKKVHIVGNKKVGEQAVFDIVKNNLGGKYYGLYPKNNSLIYPKAILLDSLMQNIPWIASVAVSSNMNSMLVQIEEREPKYLWCEDESMSVLELSCYYLDKDGFTFDKAPTFSDHIYLEFYGGNKRGGYMRRSVLPTGTLGPVLEAHSIVDRLMKGEDYYLGHPYGVYIHNNGDYDMLFENGKNRWKIMFNLDTDILKKLKAVLGSPFFMEELKNVDNKLQYMDLRFGKKVFYKFEKPQSELPK
jgi:hypothetical protein